MSEIKQQMSLNPNIPVIDTWVPQPEDVIYQNNKGIIYAPVMSSLNIQGDYDSLNFFIMNPKKCYNSQAMRDHTCLYLNYFEKYYDPEHELLVNYAHIKYMIDYVDLYSQEDLFDDIFKYIMDECVAIASVWRSRVYK